MKTLKKVLFLIAGICLLMTCSKSDDFFNNDLPDNDLKSTGVIKGVYDYVFTHYYSTCAGEYVNGICPTYFMITSHNYKEMPTIKYYLAGETTHNIYECSQPIVMHTNNDGDYTWASIGQVRLNQKLIAVLHWTFHVTTNANGEIIVDKAMCFERCVND